MQPGDHDLNGKRHPSNTYFLQVNPLMELPLPETQTVPLHVLCKLDSGIEPFYVPILQTNQLERQGRLQLRLDTSDISLSSSKNDQVISNEVNYKNNIQCQRILPLNTQLVEEKVSETNLATADKYKKSRQKVNKVVENSQCKPSEITYVHFADRDVLPRAYAVLPAALQLRRDVISPRRPLPARARFGPVKGIKTVISHKDATKMISEAANFNRTIFLSANTDETVTYIDVSDKDKSNWLGLLPLGTVHSANICIYEEGGDLYGITAKHLPMKTPLAIGYSKEYIEKYKLPNHFPEIDLQEAMEHRRWFCHECQRGLASAALLQRHMDIHHNEEKPVPRRRYRCKQCSGTFSRLYTLKRHKAVNCTSQPDESEPIQDKSGKSLEKFDSQRLMENCSQIEDSKMPSDESLQNYTNGLDFSTTLFDTDRIPNLDISGSFKETELLNPYYILGDKDENSMGNVGYAKFSNRPEDSHSSPVKKKTSKESQTVSCPKCKQFVKGGKLRQHARECSRRCFQCHCGRVFTNKDSFAQHVYEKHPTDVNQHQAPAQPDIPYKCEECGLKFKRRGMLVNHLVRAHGGSGARVPLAPRPRLFPCAACPRLYRSAATRARHHAARHPGVVLRGGWLAGAPRALAPAACAACPRQYGTRAKLLQHVRARHPALSLKESADKNKDTSRQIQSC